MSEAVKCFGELVDSYEVGAVRVVVRYGCINRDQYELRTSGPLPSALRDALAKAGVVRGGDALYVVEIEGMHQITVAPAQGRLVVMPRLSRDRPSQRSAADELATLVDALLTSG